jgi:hypothetical protein
VLLLETVGLNVTEGDTVTEPVGSKVAVIVRVEVGVIVPEGDAVELKVVVSDGVDVAVELEVEVLVKVLVTEGEIVRVTEPVGVREGV